MNILQQPELNLDPNTLADRFLSSENFLQAFNNVAAKQGGPGVDEETIDIFKQNLHGNISQLRDDVSSNRYRPRPCKQVLIPKDNNKFRELRIPTVRDRIVQHALLNVLNPIFEQQFADVSFAYRPNLSYLDAVNEVARCRDLGYRFVLDADITKFFDNIHHQRLIQKVRNKIEHPGILGLIQSWISVGILTNEGVITANKGIPQGSVVSPLLANIYLDEFDQFICNSPWQLVRYADDFLVLTKSLDDVIQAYSQVDRLLKSMHLTLHPEKSLITSFKEGFRFLGHGFLEDAIFPLESPKSAKKGGKKKRRQQTSHRKNKKRN